MIIQKAKYALCKECGANKCMIRRPLMRCDICKKNIAWINTPYDLIGNVSGSLKDEIRKLACSEKCATKAFSILMKAVVSSSKRRKRIDRQILVMDSIEWGFYKREIIGRK